MNQLHKQIILHYIILYNITEYGRTDRFLLLKNFALKQITKRDASVSHSNNLKTIAQLR